MDYFPEAFQFFGRQITDFDISLIVLYVVQLVFPAVCSKDILFHLFKIPFEICFMPLIKTYKFSILHRCQFYGYFAL